MEIDVSNITVINEEKVQLLGIYTANRLNFDYDVNQLYQKAEKKFHALIRVFNYMNT